jgi:hypothetical protein
MAVCSVGHIISRVGASVRGTSHVRRVAALISMVSLVFLGVTFNAGMAAASSPYPNGTMFIADENCACVWEVPAGGGSPSFFAGGSESPQDVVFDTAGDLFWTQAQDGTVDEVSPGGSAHAVASGFSSPWGITVDGSGDIYVAAFGGPGGQPEGLYEIPSGGSPMFVTGAYGVFTSLAIDGNGDLWGAGGSAELVLIPHGSTTGEIVTVPGYGYINGVRLDAANDLYASTGSSDVAVELPSGSTTPASFGSGLSFTEGVAVDGSGDVFVGQSSTVSGFGKVYKIAGGVQSVYASGSLATTGGLALWPAQAPASRPSSSVALTTSSPSTVSTQTTVTVTATESTGGSGAVQFDDNGRAIGGLVAAVGGVAQLSTTLPAGSNSLTATYLGDSSAAPSVSNALNFTATAVPTTTTLTLPGGKKVHGDSQVTVDAAVTGSGGTPTGSVDFYVNGNYVTSGTLDGSGQTSVTFGPTPGTSNVTATYTGDSVYAGSSSNPGTFKTVPPYTPNLSTNVHYGVPDSSGAVKVKIKVTVGGVSVEPAPTGTVTANNGFTCGALSAVGGTHNSASSCSAKVPSGFFGSVKITYHGNSVYDPGTTSAFVDNGGG